MTRHAVTAASIHGHPGADTVVIEDGHILAVAEGSEWPDLARSDHPSAVIAPTFSDSHLHPLGYAGVITGTSLKDASDLDDLADRLRAAHSARPGDALVASRLDDTPLGRLPDRHDIDQALGDLPAIVYRYCGHIAVASTGALRLAGVDASTPDPPGGVYDRDRHGHPTGVLRETAVEPVGTALDPLLPAPTDVEVLAALQGLVAVGLTHIGAMVGAGAGIWCGVGNELETLCRLADDLPLDMDVMVIADTPEILLGAADRIDAAGGRLRFWGWKAFADGSLGGHTAWMWAPFSDQGGTGTRRLDPEWAVLMARTSLERGGVAAIHAIGDRAVDEVVELQSGLIDAGANPDHLRVEHLSVCTDEAIARLADTGIIASVQPSFLSSEPDWVPARLGTDRVAYRLGDMAAAGVRMIGGSDCPVEKPDPLVGIAAAVNRPGWHDDQHLSVDTAVDLYTTAAVSHAGLPPALTPGSPAHFVVVDGALGDEDATVEAVYRHGERQQLAPAEWPG